MSIWIGIEKDLADLINIEINVSAEFTWLWRLEKVKAGERKLHNRCSGNWYEYCV